MNSKKKCIFITMFIMTLLLLFPMNSEAKSNTQTTKTTAAKPNPYTVKKVSSKKYKNRWGIKKISQKELKTLAKIVYLEAGNQGDKGERAVIEVIFNRVASKKFPNSIMKVLSQKHQFSTWGYVNKGKLRTKEIKNIYKVLNGDTNILSKKAVFFSRGPYNRKIELHYKAHYFCRY